MANLVYKYGLLNPTCNGALVDEQMRKAHRYRNTLVEIEHERRATYRAVMASHPDVGPLEADLAAIVEELDAAREVILQQRAKTRSRSDTLEQRQVVRDLGAKAKEARGKVKAARKAVIDDPDVRAKLDAAEEHSRMRVKAERNRCGVYWGTYLLQESDADRARKEKTPPKFRRWTKEGRVSVQIQKGMAGDEVWGGEAGGDTRVRIERVSSDAHDQGKPRGVRRRAQRTVLWLRVGSDGRDPVWAKWPMIMHRPLPPGAEIKVVTVSKRYRNCIMWRWEVDLTLYVPDEVVLRPTPASGVLALNLGHCLRPNGTIRAGYVVGDDGFQQEILVTKKTIDDIGKTESIRGFRDNNMNEMRERLVQWHKDVGEENRALAERISSPSRPEGGPGDSHLTPFAEGMARLGVFISLCKVPGWILHRIPYVHTWRSPERFRDLVKSWSEKRFDGDEEIFTIMNAWYEREVHLENYESGRRYHALHRRREEYRVLAAQLSQRYRTLVIDDTDLRVFQASGAPESEKVDISAIKRNQRIAAGSELRNVFGNAFGGRISKCSARDKTRRCYHCGHVDDWDRTAFGRGHKCTGCGASWDQDANFCRNLLREHACSTIADEDNPAPAADKKPSRSARLRASKAAKAA